MNGTTQIPKIQRWNALVKPTATPITQIQFNTLGPVTVTQDADTTTLESTQFADPTILNVKVTPVIEVGVGTMLVFRAEYDTNKIAIVREGSSDEVEYNIEISKIN